MDDLRGIWADDTAHYLTDMRHPVIRREWEKRQIERGWYPADAASLRDRRQFDREMVAKYGEICPPPARTEWHLKIYDILDAQEERAEREKAEAIAARNVTYEEVYVDEAI
ncbi:MAG: hypothetical protein IKL13_00430 [Clostridia bacterium]|nr:hypothetical protein [Clostridia bacterium]